MTLNTDERLDYVNDNLSLIQKTGGLTFGTDALLLAGYISKRARLGAELGGGGGIISMLLLTRGKLECAHAYEIQEDYALLTSRNAELNHLSERLTSIHSDIRAYRGGEIYDAVYSNPPYMKTTSGKENDRDAKNIARHEVFGGIDDFILSASKMLKWGGDFAVVYRPDRLSDLIYAMRSHNIEPKRMTFVHADGAAEASMVLVCGIKGGKCGLYLTPPLIIYRDECHKEYSDSMNYIMENGSFPTLYQRRG